MFFDELISDETPEICVSYLRNVYNCPHQGRLTLDHARITDWRQYESFEGFIDDLWTFGAYPKAQAHKMQSYGWTPTLFLPGPRPISPIHPDGKPGVWRHGKSAADVITTLYLDLDNANKAEPHVSIDRAERTLNGMGVAHALYTSYSHTPELHKLRIIVSLSRHATWDEAFGLFVAFNWIFDHQLDKAIYDRGDFLYSPPHKGERRRKAGFTLDVDLALAFARDRVPDESRAVSSRISKSAAPALSAPEWTPERLESRQAQMADTTVRSLVTMHDPELFNPEWLPLLDGLYIDGSHMQTLHGLLAKVWIKTGGSLSFGEMRAVAAEIDERMGGYVARKHGARKIAESIQSIMSRTVAPRPTPGQEQHFALQNTLKRLRRKTK
jgi:hypothetical protein